MKKNVHPDYRPVVFKDNASGLLIMTRSTIKTKETVKWEDGKDYPLAKVEISSESHPFYTGNLRLVDTEGRVDKFKKKYARFGKTKKDA